ncbi:MULTISPECIES: iron ABC transporter permease [Lysinibacillus]|uniref:Iron ABC transporter permease n=1 Tax=Lysinibacillus antri TaxID=2498145 RepID=A0A432L8W5_9BACI|nr:MULTISPECIES: iron ABC transporter permease [Lysinibacillus]RUL49028.1 iron ABC transporter permease [Lysinibacillus antri]TSI04729.1 iron ABC transporter permease [Lysinibacillus sp. BW-2-10]
MKLDLIKRNLKKELNSWWIISLVGAVVILLPILFIFFTIFQEPNENWLHIRQYLLKNYVTNTILLVVLTGIFTAFLGVSLAWLIAAYDFPLRKFFRWGLLLPLSIPTFIAAYTYRTMLGYTGIIQSTLRNQYDYQINSELLSISGIRGAIFIFTMFLFPYVYMITRAFLESQSTSYIENARLLGRKPIAIFFKIVLPLARPAIVGGTVLVIFEVLGDYGVTSLLGIHTISTAIFQTWFGMYDVNSAMRLAAWLMVIIMGVFLLEKLLRQRRRYHISNKSRPLVPVKLKGIKGIGAFIYCGLVFLISFLIPFIQLIAWAKMTFNKVWDLSFITLIYQTVYLAVIATIIILIFSVIVANVCRSHSSFSFVISKIITSGYSIPGPIIAIGVLAIFISLDKWLAPFYKSIGLGEAPLILSLSLIMLVIGYFIRFMATGFNAIEVGFEKIGTKYTEASRMLGLGITKTFFKVEFPLIKGALISGFIITFVEICKELPLALLLRPFNFETLATKTYQYAHDEQIYEASISSLLIIGISILSVVLIQLLGKKVK